MTKVVNRCTIKMFGSIIVSGMHKIARCGITQSNTVIVTLPLAIGIGFSKVQGIFAIMPQMVEEVLQSNCVAIVFLVALFFNLGLPKNMELS